MTGCYCCALEFSPLAAHDSRPNLLLCLLSFLTGIRLEMVASVYAFHVLFYYYFRFDLVVYRLLSLCGSFQTPSGMILSIFASPCASFLPWNLWLGFELFTRRHCCKPLSPDHDNFGSEPCGTRVAWLMSAALPLGRVDGISCLLTVTGTQIVTFTLVRRLGLMKLGCLASQSSEVFLWGPT